MASSRLSKLNSINSPVITEEIKNSTHDLESKELVSSEPEENSIPPEEIVIIPVTEDISEIHSVENTVTESILYLITDYYK